MIREVATPKAALAGTAGAIAMEVVTLGLNAAGVPAIDFIREIAAVSSPFGHQVGLIAGALFHVAVGISWALVYSYFFWGRLRWAPALQGLAFAAIPATLAVVFVYPQLRLMQLHSGVADVRWTNFTNLSLAAALSIVVENLVYGLTMGAIYSHPVGYGAGRRPSLPSPPGPLERTQLRDRPPSAFIFATGLECSYPTIERGRWRRDELRSTGHYRHWQEDFELCRRIGITHVRYGPPLHLTFAGPGKFDWSWSDDQMEELRRYGPEPIADLCHFGVPDWLGTLQNPELVEALPEYAAAFAERYPWVRFYTPINEMYVCARMSALQGVWNEQDRDDAAFIRAAFHLAGASAAMADEILKRRPDAIFINSESSEFTQPCCPNPEIQHQAQLDNERRFLPLDLLFGHELSKPMQAYVKEHGIVDQKLREAKSRKVPERSVLGIDYYEWNERLINVDGKARALGELFGWFVIANQYYQRYRRPLMHTETNRMDANDAPKWLWRQWHNVQLLRKTGVPLIGFTWYSLTDQIDWSIGLSKPLGLVFPVGLVDLNRDVRLVGLAYKQLIDMFCGQPEFRESPELKELMG